MTIKTTLSLLLAASLLSVGCGKKNDNAEPGGADQGAGATPPPSTAAAAAPAAGDVATYPNQVPQGGTVRLLQPFTVHQAADVNSPTLTHVGIGQWINLKASYSNWMLIEWPSGVGQMSPGWIELRGVNDPRVQVAQPDAGVTPPVTPTVTTRPVVTAPTASAPRRGIQIKPRK